jgi:predicted metalloprotease with PDZ domain
MELADQAAEVYSYSGLLAKAELLESLGKFSDAWEYFLKLEERYNNSEDLMAFILRYKAKTHDTRYDGELQGRLKKIFPNGLEKVGLKNFSGAPADGVIIQQENTLVTAAGLRKGDIIVALYGIRAHNFEQYSYARETTTNAQMDLIVWQQNHYTEMKASPPNHRFDADFATYPKR